jgi:cytochrome c peroxidase
LPKYFLEARVAAQRIKNWIYLQCGRNRARFQRLLKTFDHFLFFILAGVGNGKHHRVDLSPPVPLLQLDRGELCSRRLAASPRRVRKQLIRITADLMHQSISATLTHAQAVNQPTHEQQNDIVRFELGLTSAQAYDARAGLLNDKGATGGPAGLSKEGYYPGINDSLGAAPHGNAFNSVGFTLFDDWDNPDSSGRRGGYNPEPNEAREKIAAGQKLFNTHPLTISNVRGLNDNAALAKALGTTVPIAPFQGFCTTCHDTPNVGNHSLPLALDIGTGHDPTIETDPLIANGVSQLNFPDLPVFEITGYPDPFAEPGGPSKTIVIYTTDPGKALISGLCSGVSRTKGPILRGLAARAPYFHNGAARNLTELIEFHNLQFQMNLTSQEKLELIAFLNSL